LGAIIGPMAYRRTTFAPDEWYHCYNRGVDKRTVFETPRDYERFSEALYLSNSVESVARGIFQHLSHSDIMHLQREEPLIAIGAYCLIPNHFHLLIKEIVEGGISRFMHRLGTSYTMYFNIKNERTGNLFMKPFRSKHVADNRYFARVAQYIHLNPAELFEPRWKEGTVRNMETLEKNLRAFKYSSLPVYAGARETDPILDLESVELLREELPTIDTDFLKETAAYYADIGKS